MNMLINFLYVIDWNLEYLDNNKTIFIYKKKNSLF